MMTEVGAVECDHGNFATLWIEDDEIVLIVSDSGDVVSVRLERDLAVKLAVMLRDAAELLPVSVD
jgi:hypothetical protein